MKKFKFLVILLGLMLIMVGCVGEGGKYDYYVEVNNLDGLPDEGEYLVYYFSDTWPYCLEFAPELQEYSELEGSLRIYRFDFGDGDAVKAGEEFTKKFDVEFRGFPTIYYVKDGVVEQDFVGIHSKEDLPKN